MFNRRIHSKTAAALFSASLMLAAIPVAASAGEARVAVSAADLNLASPAGRAVLERRISRAVEDVCGAPDSRMLWQVDAYRVCSKDARASAASQVDAMVAAAQGGRKVATASAQ